MFQLDACEKTLFELGLLAKMFSQCQNQLFSTELCDTNLKNVTCRKKVYTCFGDIIESYRLRDRTENRCEAAWYTMAL